MHSLIRYACSAVLLAASVPISAAQERPNIVLKVGQPVAIDGLPESGYFVLSQDGAVYHYVPSPSGLRFSNRFDNGEFGQSFDLTYSQTAGVVISSFSNATHLGYVNRYDANGHLIKSWQVRKVATGIDFNSNDGFVYFATADSKEIYRVSISGGGSGPEYFCEIGNANRLGSLVIDSAKQVIYVADTAEGIVFRVDVKTKKVTQQANGLRLPSALRFDDQARSLYIADAISHQVLAMKADDANAHPVPVVSKGLRSPSGIAAGPSGTILISDVESNGVFQASTSSPAARRR